METNSSSDLFEQQTRPAGSLNTLTTLTFIGCGISYLGTIYNFLKSSNYESELAKIEDMRDKMDSGSLGAKVLQGSIDMIQKTHEYRYILARSGILFTTLCLVGAMQMRQLKKSGYPLYVVGELAPFVLFFALVGGSLLSNLSIALSALVGVVFVTLYTTQRKYLVK